MPVRVEPHPCNPKHEAIASFVCERCRKRSPEVSFARSRADGADGALVGARLMLMVARRRGWERICPDCWARRRGADMAAKKTGNGGAIPADGQHYVKVEPFERTLRCELPPAELAKKADRAAHLLGERDEITEAGKAAASAIKSQIKEKDAELRRLSNEIRDKSTYQAVDCERRFDFRLGRVVEVRLDNDEVLAERAMTAEERQLELDMAPTNGTAKAEPASDETPLPTEKRRKSKGRKAGSGSEAQPGF